MTSPESLRNHILKRHRSEGITNENGIHSPLDSKYLSTGGLKHNLQYSTPEKTDFHEKNRCGYGNHYLVAKSNFNQTLSDVYTRIGSDEVQIQMQIADFVATLSFQKRKMFCNIIAAVSKSIENNIIETYVHKISTNCNYTCIPNCHVQTRRVYLEGNNALLNNIPHPTPSCLDDDQTYLSICEMIGNYLASDIPMNEIWLDREPMVGTCRYSNLYDTPEVSHIVQDAAKLYCHERVLILLGIEFSDDFDPNNSVKKNRQCVWMKSMTISPPYLNLHGMTTTFPISFGVNDNFHQIVENCMALELQTLSDHTQSNMFYHKRTDRMVRVHFELLMSLQDQPERRSCTDLLLGNGLYAARWGFSCNFGAIKHRLVSCSQCLRMLMTNQPCTDECTQCTNWDVISSSTTLLQSDVNKKYH